MERIKPPLTKSYPPLVLGVADLEALEDVLRTAVKDYAAYSGNYKYTSIAELSAHVGKKRIHNLKFEGSKPYTSLTFAPHDARVYVGDDDLVNAGLFQKIDAILTPRVRRFSIIYDPRMLVLIGPAVAGVSALVGGQHRAVLPIVVGVVLAVTIWSGWISIKRHSVIDLSASPETFWARNRDQILVAVIAAVVGSVVTLIATRLLG
jgi:hypothetical protein